MVDDQGNYDREYSVHRHYDPASSQHDLPIGDILQQVVRFGGAIVGIVLIVIGLTFVLRIFGVIVATLNSPGNIRTLVEDWTRIIGNEQLNVLYEGKEIVVGPVIAVGILGVGALVLVSISMQLITNGAKVISITMGEREALKQLLKQVRMSGALSGLSKNK